MNRSPLSDAAARQRALDPMQSFIVQAPAGSGKTELLTQRFLRLLALVEHPEEVVAITFTRKAAGEMRARIIDALQLAQQPCPDEPHRRQTWELASAVIAHDRVQGWNLLEYPARLRVLTIDAFNTWLAQQMPLQAGLGAIPGTENYPATLYREAANRTVNLIADANDWRDAVAELLLHLDNDSRKLSELLARLLAKRDLWLRHLLGNDLQRDALEAVLHEEITARLQAAFALIPSEIRNGLPTLFDKAASYAERDGAREFEILSALKSLREFPPADAAAISDWRNIARLLLTRSDAQFRKRADRNIGAPTDDRPHKNKFEQALQQLAAIEGLAQQLDEIRELPDAHYPDSQWNILEALARLLPLSVAQLNVLFNETGKVDFAEIAMRARQALGEPDAPTDLALYLDYRISHLLVDEFQDTSLAQVELLERLIAGWTPDDGRSLFLVGDPMQSIYRFREAEVGLFLRVRRHGIGMLQLESLQLDANFRSTGNIVEWVNGSFRNLFPQIEDVASGAVCYHGSVPQHAATDDSAVTVHPLFGNDGSAEANRVVDLIIQSRMQEETSCAVLVRSRNHLVDIVQELRTRGIGFQAVEIDRLQQLPVISDLLALTRSVLNVFDRTAWLATLRAPWLGMTLNDAVQLVDENWPILEQLHDESVSTRLQVSQRRLAKFLAAFNSAFEQKGRRTLSELVETTWYAIDGPATLTNAADIDNARSYFEFLRDYETAGDVGDINEYVEMLTELFGAPDPQASDKVQLMTLHKAKGLEFDVVIMPGLSKRTAQDAQELLVWTERPRDLGRSELLLAPLQASGDERDRVYRFIQAIRKQQADMEKVRLLYVGATRARRNLHLLGHVAIKEADGKTEIVPPSRDSMLALLWPQVENEFAKQLPMEIVNDGNRRSARLLDAVQPIQRLGDDFADVELPASILRETSAALAASDTAVEYQWAGDTARKLGTLVHRYLEQMADGAAMPTPGTMKRQLDRLGIHGQELENARKALGRVFENLQHSEKLRWLLAPHDSARNEWALSGLVDGQLVNATIDRSFVDDGVRWIIDYKTSDHQGAALAVFLASERERYEMQMQRYAALARQLDARPIRLGLYFPLLDELVSWDAE